MPVGGVKEKVIAAKSAGIQRVILPEKNRKDLEDVSEPVLDALTFEFVAEIDEVLDLAFGDRLPRGARNPAEIGGASAGTGDVGDRTPPPAMA